MGKLNKHANLYSKDGELLREAPLKAYSIQELEDWIDAAKPGKARDLAIMRLYELYRKYGNPHEQELIDRIKNAAKLKTDEDQIKRALGEVGDSLDKPAVQEGGERSVQSTENQVQKVSYDVNSNEIEDAQIIE